MIAYTCPRCQSTNLRKNGRAASGQQKFHCKDCNRYGTLDRKDAERQLREQAAENLLSERLSQRAIARTLRMSRRKVAALIKKKS
jgi:transposase-like protein